MPHPRQPTADTDGVASVGVRDHGRASEDVGEFVLSGDQARSPYELPTCLTLPSASARKRASLPERKPIVFPSGDQADDQAACASESGRIERRIEQERPWRGTGPIDAYPREALTGRER
jgi:hypothetical protein